MTKKLKIIKTFVTLTIFVIMLGLVGVLGVISQPNVSAVGEKLVTLDNPVVVSGAVKNADGYDCRTPRRVRGLK